MRKENLYQKYNVDQLSPVEIYKLILNGEIKHFPPNTWQQPDSIEYAAEIIRFLIEIKLNWSTEDIKNHFKISVFRENHLAGMLKYCFNENAHLAINAAYPGKFKEWDFLRVTTNFWTKKNIVKGTKWLIEEKLKWNECDLRQKKLTQKIFFQNGMGNLLSCDFVRYKPFRALQLAYPNRFKEWEVSRIAFWNPKIRISAIKWLIEEKLKCNENDIRQKLSIKIFKKYGLGGLLRRHFHNNIKIALDAAYSGRWGLGGNGTENCNKLKK